MTGIFRGTGTSGSGVAQPDVLTRVAIAGDTMTGYLNVPAGATGTQVPQRQEIDTALALKANLISPTFTTPNIGVATGTSFNSITALSSTTPAMDGTATIGTGTTTARGDHVHPSDTSRALLAGSSSQNFSANNIIGNYATTATAAGTTTLTVASSQKQFFTGTTTQTIVLPDVTTLTLGHSFVIENNSTGIITVNSSGANLVTTIQPLTKCEITCILITGTTAASWSSDISIRRTGQVQSHILTTAGSGTTLVPLDATIPQNTEGDQYLTVTLTPISATSTLRITACVNISNSVNNSIAMSLFRDSTASALCTTAVDVLANTFTNLNMEFMVTSGSTSSTTFNIRIGGTSAGTLRVNSIGATQYFGASFLSSLTVAEFLP